MCRICFMLQAEKSRLAQAQGGEHASNFSCDTDSGVGDDRQLANGQPVDNAGDTAPPAIDIGTKRIGGYVT
jgi:hypothetical protein